ncbi:MAG: hypothetical protein G01um101418_361 [Parcubacteria group bacterium Gr01-1014_18]|nr:MAG: hypothetical protein Greene041636_263 [Parcubacteria group bacterium Greene0416_36]TSC81221.1 MAG: hypothetical protein G01um101418_361 [Parcubacteria group bacterium Gr01-1014_18]TSC99218.1 MAG: hypothetical protein Greene101420_363 [Parcubacteria group bacterium Greene1014_20]TSD07424.1 MAG: hypothetical protein Greene07142_123 [Parcubacteria group bacterium Greene0714_2]
MLVFLFFLDNLLTKLLFLVWCGIDFLDREEDFESKFSSVFGKSKPDFDN